MQRLNSELQPLLAIHHRFCHVCCTSSTGTSSRILFGAGARVFNEGYISGPNPIRLNSDLGQHVFDDESVFFNESNSNTEG